MTKLNTSVFHIFSLNEGLIGFIALKTEDLSDKLADAEVSSTQENISKKINTNDMRKSISQFIWHKSE